MDIKDQTNNSDKVYYAIFDTKICPVYIAKNNIGVCSISFLCKPANPFSPESETQSFRHMKTNFIKVQEDAPFLKDDILILKKYFRGEKTIFDFSLDLSSGTDFQKKVWKKLQEIPYGQCKTYKWVAEQTGNSKAVRAVGMANKKNPLPLVIPCHRVIGSNGKLIGYEYGLSIKKRLLEMEGHSMIFS